MKGTFWKLADQYAIHNLKKKERLEPQFCYPKHISFNIPNIFPKITEQKTDIIDNQYENRKICYESLIENGLCNRNVEIIHKKPIFNNATKKNIILVHGWKQDSFKELNGIILNYLLNKGYNIYYFSLPFHLNRTAANALYSGEYMINANINRTIISFKQAISDLKILINYIKSFSNREVFVVGLSLGGIVSNLITAFEKNIDGIISLFYPNSMAYLTYNHPIEMFILNELKNNNIDEKKLADYWNVISPSNYKPLISREKFLFVSGKYDLIIPLADSDVLWKAWNVPNRIVLNCGHSGIVLLRKQVQKHVENFLERI